MNSIYSIMVATIVLNQNSLVKDGNNNSFFYSFPNSVSFPHHEIAIQSISMFYSWANININLSNNQLVFYFPTNDAGAVSTGAASLATITITIPTGQYEISDLNALIQYYMVQNGMYLTNSANQNVYYLEMFVNATRYSVQFNTFPFPNSSQFTWNATTGQWTGNTGTPYAGWTTPIGNAASGVLPFSGFPSATTTYNPAILIPASFNDIVGFPANTTTVGAPTTYPNGQVLTAPITLVSQLDTAGVNRSYLSSTSPQVQPNSSIYFSISNIENKYAIPNSIIFSLNPAVAFGEQIIERPPQFAWNRLLNGTYNNIRLTILGLNYQPLQILDPNMTIVLVIRDTKDNTLLDAINQAQGGK